MLSVGAALGADERGLQLGLGQQGLHLSGTGPVDAFLPVLIFSVLFGLSMDYEVYLVSRIQEEWRHGRSAYGRRPRNHLAVTTGQAKSGPVIAAAAGIMILVFGSFMFGARELAGVRLRARLLRPRRRPGHPQPARPRPHAPHRPGQLGPATVARPHPAPASRRGRGTGPRQPGLRRDRRFRQSGRPRPHRAQSPARRTAAP